MREFQGSRISFLGRLRRSRFAPQAIGTILFMLVGSVVLLGMLGNQSTLPVFGILVIGLVFLVSRAVCRLQDMNQSGWILILALLYVIGAIYFTVGQNWLGLIQSNAFAEGDEQRMILMGLKRFTKAEPVNTKDYRRRIADKMIGEGKYCF